MRRDVMSHEYRDRDRLEYLQFINRVVKTSDNHHIGNTEAIGRDFFVIRRGFLVVHHYYIPRSKLCRCDDELWLTIDENEVKEKYERNKSPDPFRYYVKDYPYYTAGYFPPLAIIKNKWILTNYRKKSLDGLERFDSATIPQYSKKSTRYVCDLCTSEFNSSKKLSEHILSYHN